MTALLKLIIIGILVLFLLTIGPWCFIWGLNTLIHAGGITTFTIPFTIKTWLGALFIGGLAVLPAARRS